MLNIKKIFKIDTAQGVAGLTAEGDVFKVSQAADLSIIHEAHVGGMLLPLTTYLPHFARYKGYLQNNMYHVPRALEDYLEDCAEDLSPEQKFIVSTRPRNSMLVGIDALLLEFVGVGEVAATSLKEALKAGSLKASQKQSIVLQLACALEVAYRAIKFTHNDLHAGNVMLRKCDPNIVFKYVIGGKTYAVPTHGVIPVIIDYGLSQCESCGDGTLSLPLTGTKFGLVNSYTNPTVDYCRLLGVMKWKSFMVPDKKVDAMVNAFIAGYGDYCEAFQDIRRFFLKDIKLELASTKPSGVAISSEHYLSVLSSAALSNKTQKKMPRRSKTISQHFHVMIWELSKFEKLVPVPPVRLLFLEIVRGIKFRETPGEIKANVDKILASVKQTETSIDYTALITAIVELAAVCASIVNVCSSQVEESLDNISNMAPDTFSALHNASTLHTPANPIYVEFDTDAKRVTIDSIL